MKEKKKKTTGHSPFSKYSTSLWYKYMLSTTLKIHTLVTHTNTGSDTHGRSRVLGPMGNTETIVTYKQNWCPKITVTPQK